MIRTKIGKISMVILPLLTSVIILFGASVAFSQSGQDEQLPPGPVGNIPAPAEPEAGELEQFESELSSVPEPVAPSASSPAQGGGAAPVNIETLSDLSRLAPFRDVSVLQKRFLPKTQRFQLHGGFTMITNDPWYWGLGANLRLGYYFREAWGVEFSSEFFSHSERDQVKDLRINNGIDTDSIVYIRDYLGVDLIWSPMYGKMSLKNLRIIPFDLYFSGGAGMVTLGNAMAKSTTSLHLGTGQIFALSKATAFRWSFDWKYFNATPRSKNTAEPLKAGAFSYFMLSIGVSYFFPEAKYR